MSDTISLDDLNNPNDITSLFVAYKHEPVGRWIEASEGQRFQEMPGSWELWQTVDNGRVMRVQRWLKKSVITTE